MEKKDAVEKASQTYSCLVAGATGLIGSALVRQLLEDPSCRSIIAVTRRPLDYVGGGGSNMGNDKLRVVTADFDLLPQALEEIEAVDVIFCALGTTIKAAGSQEAFRKVDYDYPLALAEWAEQRDVPHYLVVTSMGSSTTSPFFYSRVKGELQDKLRRYSFQTIHFFQPSLLLGDRPSVRVGESIGTVVSKALTWAMVGPLRRFRPIAGENVAHAMRAVARGVAYAPAQASEAGGSTPEVIIHRSDSIAEIAKRVTQTTG
ncbi:NAD(P)H-binding protein [Paenibacillus sp. NPDC058071]|uniref:NAD(P)H-binding protein n=1 Tax=Paenibacillus sp. NPDC058071 TaxID=3346326 RepID=UPI0036DEE66D